MPHANPCRPNGADGGIITGPRFPVRTIPCAPLGRGHCAGRDPRVSPWAFTVSPVGAFTVGPVGAFTVGPVGTFIVSPVWAFTVGYVGAVIVGTVGAVIVGTVGAELPDLPEPRNPGERSRLEDALVIRLRDFLMEPGKGFSFVGRQFRVSTRTSHFHGDPVFHNYLLKCFALIDLKTKKLSHGDIGRMDMDVKMFDDLKRGEDDNPTLGIILCADKDETLVRYSVLSENRQLFASKYLLILPSGQELQAELERRHILEWPTEGGGE
jgi:hypothetical protein